MSFNKGVAMLHLIAQKNKNKFLNIWQYLLIALCLLPTTFGFF
jgi:hypothetical protein